MSLPNASILRIDRVTVNPGGSTYSPGADIQGLRGRANNVTARQRYTLGAKIEDVETALTIRKQELAAAGEDAPTNGIRVVYQVDGEDEQTGEAIFVRDFVKDGPNGVLTRWQLFLKKVS